MVMLFVILLLLTLTSILALSFKAISSFTYSDQTNHGTSISASGVFYNDTRVLAEYPQTITQTAKFSTYISSSINIMLCVAAGLATAWSFKKGPIMISRKQHQITFAAVVVNFLITFAAFVVAFVVHLLSDHFDTNFYIHQNQSSVYQGRFDLETWTCETQNFYPTFGFGDSNILGRQCHLEMGARWLSLVQMVTCAIVSILLLLNWEGKQSVMCERSHRREEIWDLD
ncbi:hypothetical protein EJ08DRAFT_662486 [Tothia fuscella]|uniref:Uncharacterized protein n=1 Tax=Tothia fuscella TaxID=1048955 RepID=A0A9P4TVS4_9PEZI|nr:hypothetical protein EJ08DRAFT_662486 [Tothia fuscella]